MTGDTHAQGLDKALEKLNERSLWIWGIFLLASSPGVFNAYHIMVTLFLSHIPPYWCRVLELAASNWTAIQIRNITSPSGLTGSSCTRLDWNYTQLAELGYEEALQYVTSHPHPSQSKCADFFFEEDVPHSSTVTEWNLVCDRLPLKSNVQSSIAAGKFVGGFIFGFVADKYGRKMSFILSCLIYIVMGPFAALASSYWLFIFARFCLGLSGSGCYEAAYTILTELASKERRAILGCIYNISYPVGYISLSLIAYMFPAWRSLQMAISLPMLCLLLHCWLLPESPRWLVTKRRNSEAWAIVKSVDDSFIPPNPEEVNVKVETSKVALWKKILIGCRNLFSLFGTGELCLRICICYFTWFVAALSYYVLALNADNFSSNRYLYLALAGMVEVPSYLLPLLVLIWLGRKTTEALLFLVSGVALLSIYFISQDYQTAIVVVALLGRFADSAVFAVIILHTSELFPTSNRNTAIGSSLAICQLGSILAPYVVDMLGKTSWHAPSTLCGGLALASALLCLLLPETRGRPLLDTVQELKESSPRDRVSFRNCCSFS